MKDLDDDSVSRQVHSPGQGGGTDQDLEVASGEHALHQAAVRAQHASVVDAKTFRKHFFHLLVPGALDLKETVKEGVSEGVEVTLSCKCSHKTAAAVGNQTFPAQYMQ